MSDREVYNVYNAVMKLHVKYAATRRSTQNVAALVADINKLNDELHCNFCNAMTDALRRWYMVGLQGVETKDIKALYARAWMTHKKYIGGKLTDEQWRALTDDVRDLFINLPRAAQGMGQAILDEMELSDERN